MTTPAIRFGETVRKLRTKANYTQSAVADAVGVSLRYYQEVESGNKVPSLFVVIQIAKAFEVPAASLLTDLEKGVALTNPAALTRGDLRKKVRRFS